MTEFEIAMFILGSMFVVIKVIGLIEDIVSGAVARELSRSYEQRSDLEVENLKRDRAIADSLPLSVAQDIYCKGAYVEMEERQETLDHYEAKENA